MQILLQDLRYSARMLRKHPGFTLIAVLTLALGIGANTAIFSVVYGVLLKPLPYHEPERLLTVWESNLKKGEEHEFVSGANFTDWQQQNQVFESLAAYMTWNYNLTGGDDPRRLSAAVVSAGFFQLLSAEASLGRALLPEEDVEGKDDVVVLSHSLWQSRFGANRNLIGQTIMLNNRPHTVVGVMPASFSFPNERVEIWRPMAMGAQEMQNRQGKWLRVIGRLKAGVTLEQARVAMQTMTQRLEQQYPESNAGWGVNLIPLHEELVGQSRTFLFLLLGAVGFVLLMACANVANLTLARAASRQKEMAVRAALGADRWRLLRQLLLESFLLALLGSVLGLLLAGWISDALITLSPGNLPRLNQTGLDGRILGFTLALMLLTTLLFGLVPAWQASRPDLNDTLRDEGRGTSGSSGQRLRNVLVVAEIAIGVVLLIGAGLLVRSLLRLQAVDPGFDPNRLLTMQVMLPPGKYGENVQAIAFFKQALEKIRTLPGVEAASAVQDLPLRFNATSFPFRIEGRPAEPTAQRPAAVYRAVADDYFRTTRIPLLRGRVFTAQDDLSAPPVIIINQTMARRFFADQELLGQQLRFGEPDDPAYTIVGVVGDIKHQGLNEEEGAVMYQPHAQKRFVWMRWMTLVIRTNVEPLSLSDAVRHRLAEVDKDQPVYDIATMEQLLTKSVAQPRFSTLLLGSFAVVALLLAVIGIYGVMSYAVTQRTHEIGVRMALGAGARDVLQLIVGQGVKLAALGTGFGLLAALGLTRLMKSMLFGVTATDPLTFTGIALLLPGIALLACYLPARRATKVDPMIALRGD